MTEQELFDLGERISRMLRTDAEGLKRKLDADCEPEDFQDSDEIARAASEGWAIWNGDEIQRIDFPEGDDEPSEPLSSDDEAVNLARESGLIVDSDYRVTGRWAPPELARALNRLRHAYAGDDGHEEEEALDSLLGLVGHYRTQEQEQD